MTNEEPKIILVDVSGHVPPVAIYASQLPTEEKLLELAASIARVLK